MNTRIARWTTLAATATILAATPALPAAARPAHDDLERPRPVGVATGAVAHQQPTPPSDCPLRRIGQQLIRCDTLTGADANAPSWIPQY
jgi:hypothetical protein